MHIGNKIKTEVANRNVSVTGFAKLIGKSRPYTYSIFEKEHIDTELLMQIAKVLDISVASFFDDTVSDTNQAVTGNSNIVVGRDNNGRINMAECQDKLDDALLEIKHLNDIIESKDKLLEEKERLINVLMNK